MKIEEIENEGAGVAQRFAPILLRGVLGLTMLSAVADRFGFWGPPGSPGVAWGDWAHFVDYTAKVNSFLPAGWSGVLGAIATSGEIVLGFALILGVLTRWAALATALLLGSFALAMTLSFGVKAPLDYSVWVDVAAAFVLFAWPPTKMRGRE